MLLGYSRDAESDSTDRNTQNLNTLSGVALEEKTKMNEAISEWPQDIYERPQEISRIRKLSDGSLSSICQGGGTRFLKRIKLSTGDVFKNDAQFSSRLFMNTPGDNSKYCVQFDQDSSDMGKLCCGQMD